MKQTAHPFTVHGFYCISNWGGYEIEISNDGDGARVRANFGTVSDKARPRWQQIKYTAAGDPFVCFRGRRLFLDNFLRV